MKQIFTTILFSLVVVFMIGTTASAQVGTYTQPVGTPTTQGLQYTGSYCSGFTFKVETGASTLGGIFKFITCMIEVSFIPMLFAIAVFVFIYGVVKFIGTEESAEKEDGRQFMIWGIVALAVMFSVWGLVKMLGNSFGVSNIIPQLPAGK